MESGKAKQAIAPGEDANEDTEQAARQHKFWTPGTGSIVGEADQTVVRCEGIGVLKSRVGYAALDMHTLMRKSKVQFFIHFNRRDICIKPKASLKSKRPTCKIR